MFLAVLGLDLGYVQFHKRLPETTSHLYTMSKQLGLQSVVRRSKGQLLRAHFRARSSWRPTRAGHSRRKWGMVSGTPHPSQFREACLPQRGSWWLRQLWPSRSRLMAASFIRLGSPNFRARVTVGSRAL